MPGKVKYSARNNEKTELMKQERFIHFVSFIRSARKESF